MRVVVIGGSGFIGTNVAIQLKREGHEVVVLDRIPAADRVFEQNQIAFAEGDYISGKNIRETVQEGDCVIHLVSTSQPNQSNRNILKDAEDNLLPSLRLFDICVERKAAKLIYASSGGQVYGIPVYTPIDEQHPTDPQSAYGIHKLAVEKYLQLYARLYGLGVQILRISNPYGPGQQPFRGQGVIATFIASAYLKQEVEIWGSGKAVRDYIYIDDLVAAFGRAVAYQGAEQVFNIGSGAGTSVLDILTCVEQVTGITIPKRYMDAKSSDVNTNILNCKKAAQELSWQPVVGLKEGIRRMTDHWSPDTSRFIVGQNNEVG